MFRVQIFVYLAYLLRVHPAVPALSCHTWLCGSWGGQHAVQVAKRAVTGVISLLISSHAPVADLHTTPVYPVAPSPLNISI